MRALCGLLLPLLLVLLGAATLAVRAQQPAAVLGPDDGSLCTNCSGHGQCRDDGSCACEYQYSWSTNCSQSRSELINWDVYQPYVYTVTAAFAALDLAVIGLLVYVVSGSPLALRVSVQTASYVFLVLAFSEKITYYSLDPGAVDGLLEPWLDRLLRYLFYPLLFTAYTMVLYFWASSYLKASTGRSDVLKRLRLVFVLLNVALYAVELAVTLVQALVVDDNDGHDRNRFTLLYQIYLTLVLVTISAAFLYYGVGIYVQLRKFTSMSYSGSRALRSVTFLTASTAVCFLSGIVCNMVILIVGDTSPTLFIINDAVTQVLCVVASVLVLVLLGKPQRWRSPTGSSANLHEDDKAPFLPSAGTAPRHASALEEPLYSVAY